MSRRATPGRCEPAGVSDRVLAFPDLDAQRDMAKWRAQAKPRRRFDNAQAGPRGPIVGPRSGEPGYFGAALVIDLIRERWRPERSQIWRSWASRIARAGSSPSRPPRTSPGTLRLDVNVPSS
jgi:hypothetical protein